MKGLMVRYLLALSLVPGVACGGGGGTLTLDQYFGELQAISNRGDQLFLPLTESLDREFASEAEEITVWRDFFVADLVIINDSFEAIHALRPPEVAKDPHENYVRELAQQIQAIQRTSAEMGNIESKAELDALLNSRELEESTTRLDEACSELQNVATSNEIAVDLDCK